MSNKKDYIELAVKKNKDMEQESSQEKQFQFENMLHFDSHRSDEVFDVVKLSNSEYPQTNSKSFLHLLTSPISCLQSNFKAGGLCGSMFSLIAATLGSGTSTLPYLSSENGILLAPILIILGASISYFCSMCLVRLAEVTGSDKYEDFANFCYGRKMAVFTGWCNILTLLGFVVSYIVFVKSLIPHDMVLVWGERGVPEWLGEGQVGAQVLWATVYTFIILFPLCIPRKINALRYNSAFGVLCSIYLVGCTVALFCFDSNLVKDRSESFNNARLAHVTMSGLLDSVPFVIFSFMYQPNIPIVYRELTVMTYKQMQKVLVFSSVGVVILYILGSVFGYLSLVNRPHDLAILNEKRNILEIHYGILPMKVAIIMLLFAIFAAAPVAFLPVKDTYEELIYGKQGMNSKQNLFVTIAFLVICYISAVAIPNISDAITIIGFTTNPLIGFILPIVFYLKAIPRISVWKLGSCYLILTLIISISLIGIFQFLTKSS